PLTVPVNSGDDPPPGGRRCEFRAPTACLAGGAGLGIGPGLLGWRRSGVVGGRPGGVGVEWEADLEGGARGAGAEGGGAAVSLGDGGDDGEAEAGAAAGAGAG